MGLFSFIDELFDTTEELIKDTPKTMKEKAPELASFVWENAVDLGHMAVTNAVELGQKAVTRAGKKIAQFQSEDFMQNLRNPSIDPDRRREVLSRYIERKNNAVNASIAVLNRKLENPDITDSERQKAEEEIRGFERQLMDIEHESRRLNAEIERNS